MPPYQPLRGLRVVELSSFVASPVGGLTLAQLGVDVLRIDPIGGAADYTRWPLARSGRSIYWAGLNKGKRSITVDMHSPEGREIVLRLATLPGAGAGILLSNSIGREWLSYEHLCARRPDMIDVRLVGYPDGRPALDYTVNAALGYPMVTGPPGSSEPVNHVLPAWDLLAGMHTALAILVSERQRQQNGTGDQVVVSLWDVGLASASHLGMLSEVELLGTQRSRYGNYFYGGFGRDFETADGRVMVVAPSDRQWQALVEATIGVEGMAHLAAALDADFADEGTRFEHRETIASVLGPWFRRRTVAAVEEVLVEAGVVCAAYGTFLDLVSGDRPEYADSDLMAEVDQPGIGRYRTAGTVLRSRAHERAPVRAAPTLGQDTGAVLREFLDLSETEIDRLRSAGIAGER